MTPTTELRRVTKRIAELRVRQLQLIQALNLSETEEHVIIDAFTTTDTVHDFLNRAASLSETRRRKAIALSRRLTQHSQRLDRLNPSDAKDAAVTALVDAHLRLLNEMFQAGVVSTAN